MSNRKPLFSITKKDLEITFFNGKGGGGQNRNKNMNCVRLRHPASGVMVTGQDQKSRDRNIKSALQRLVAHPQFKVWHAKATAEALNKKSIDEIVEEQMQPQNLKIEVRNEDDTRWIAENE